MKRWLHWQIQEGIVLETGNIYLTEVIYVPVPTLRTSFYTLTR